jgi:hypothetical protein
MEKMLLNLKIRRVQSETVMRWIAMEIAATPDNQRLAKYENVRESIAGTISQYGRTGIEVEESLRKNMEAISRLVCEFEANGVVSCQVHARAA